MSQAKQIQRKSITQEKVDKVQQMMQQKPKRTVGEVVGKVAKAVDTGAKIVKTGAKVAKGVAKAIKVAKFLMNDLEWYTHYEDATREMIGLNFNVVNGVKSDVLAPDDPNSAEFCLPAAALGARIEVALVDGDNKNSSLSAAYNRLYTAIRQANSGAVNWETQDLAAYLTCIRNVIAGYTVGCRALRELNRRSILTKQSPVANFKIMGLDYDTFAENGANLRNFLINMRIRLSNYAAPLLPVFERTEWMFRGSFWDSDDEKHQLYYFAPSRMLCYTWDGGDYEFILEDGFCDNLVNSPSRTGMLYSAYITEMKGVIDSLTSLPKANIISGDIVKAYGLENLFYLADVPGTTDEPIDGWNEEAATEIENAWNPIPHVSDIAFGGNQGPDGVWYSKVGLDATGISYVNASSSLKKYVGTAVVNMYKTDVSNAEVLMATRLQNTIDVTTPNMDFRGYGTELYLRTVMITFDYGTQGNTSKYQLVGYAFESITNINISFNGINEKIALSTLSLWSQFAHAPRMIPYMEGFNSSGTGSKSMGYGFFELNVYAFITDIEQLGAISDIATQSIMYTPLLVRASSNVLEYK